MPPPDYPRLPASYAYNPSRLRSIDVLLDLPTPPEQSLTHALQAAVALAQAAHSGEDRYVLLVGGAAVVEGELNWESDEVGDLLDRCERAREGQGEDEEYRIEVLHLVGASATHPQTTPLRISSSLETDCALRLTLSYDTSLLPALEATWFLSHVQTALASLLSSSSSAQLSSVTLSPSSEAATLQRYSTDPTFSPTTSYPSACRTLPDFFTHAAKLYPDDPAIHFLPDPTSSPPHTGEVILSFTQTLYLARYLASHLLSTLSSSSSSTAETHKKGNLVLPLCVSKSPYLPLSLLAISLTGCGYLALEPSFPEGRKKGICEELKGRGMLAPVAVVESAEGEKGRWESWESLEWEGKDGDGEERDAEKLLPHVLDPEELLRPLVDATVAGATAEELEKQFPLQDFGADWPEIREEGLAYLIYTSGSTGAPKGVQVEHRQVAAFLRNYRGVFGRARGERVLQFPSYAFDVSVMNIWDCFAHGSTLCFTTPSSLYSSLAQSILALRCTLVDLTPTIAALLFEHPEAQPEDGESVEEAWRKAGFVIKQVNTGGERVEKAVREKWRERGVRVVIDYGPTETTVGVVSNQSLSASPPAPFALPIGKPTGSTRIAILSPSSLLPVPLGAIGEICVLGPQVTRGYVVPKLNEDVFVELEERVEGVGETEERVYRTGDLGRWVVAEWEENEREREGWIECLGRRDGQVKVNGLRIEVGEIEQHLSSRTSPSLARGIVDTFETESINASLVAYLELSPSFDASSSTKSSANGNHHSSSDVHVLPLSTSPAFLSLVDTLKARLAEKLPAYMIPRYWLAVSRIPTQGMGKADRKTLKALAVGYDWRAAAKARSGANGNGAEKGKRAEDKTFSRDEHSEAARRAWASVLRLSEEDGQGIADQDEFMKLGGDSIRFMKLVSTLRAAGYSSLQFKQIVDAATLSACARALAASFSDSSSPFNNGSATKPYEPFSLIPSSSLPALLDELSHPPLSLPLSRLADIFPTAPSQDALLYPSFDSPVGHYYAQAVYAVESSVEEVSFERLQEGVRQLVGRYEALRSVFVVSEREGTVVAVLREGDEEVRERSTIERFEVEEGELDQVITSWLRDDRKRFTFRWGQLHLSCAFFETPEGTRKFAWGLHHAQSDGWTLELLTADLRSLIHNLPLPSRPPFHAVASWWRSSSSPPADTVDFWRSYLTSAVPLSWPSQSALNGEMLATTGASILHWSGELEALTQRHGVTPAIASRVAIAVALSIHAKAEDVTVGIVRSGRDIDVQDADEIIGPCVSVLPSRIRFTHSPSSSSSATTSPSLLSFSLAESASDRLTRVHQRVTLPQLTSLCSLPSRDSLFSILVTFQSLAERDPSPESDHLSWPIRQPPERIHMPTNYALSFEVTPQLGKRDELELACFFDERVVGEGEVDEVLKTVAKVMDYLVTAPCTTIDAVRRSLGSSSSTTSPSPSSVLPSTGADEVNIDVDPARLAALEQQTRAEWAAVLRVEEGDIGKGETFASLGGDSIAAMRLSVRLQRLNLSIPTQHLARLATVEAMGRWLAGREAGKEGAERGEGRK